MPLPPAQSPMHQLVSPWFLTQVQHRYLDVIDLRENLFTTALQEMAAVRSILHYGYDPIIDPRFRWAVQYLEKLEGFRHDIDEDIAATAGVFLDPATSPLSHQHLAAHDDRS